jgi:hypothetical protein
MVVRGPCSLVLSWDGCRDCPAVVGRGFALERRSVDGHRRGRAAVACLVGPRLWVGGRTVGAVVGVAAGRCRAVRHKLVVEEVRSLARLAARRVAGLGWSNSRSRTSCLFFSWY